MVWEQQRKEEQSSHWECYVDDLVQKSSYHYKKKDKFLKLL